MLHKEEILKIAGDIENAIDKNVVMLQLFQTIEDTLLNQEDTFHNTINDILNTHKDLAKPIIHGIAKYIATSDTVNVHDSIVIKLSNIINDNTYDAATKNTAAYAILHMQAQGVVISENTKQIANTYKTTVVFQNTNIISSCIRSQNLNQNDIDNLCQLILNPLIGNEHIININVNNVPTNLALKHIACHCLSKDTHAMRPDFINESFLWIHHTNIIDFSLLIVNEYSKNTNNNLTFIKNHCNQLIDIITNQESSVGRRVTAIDILLNTNKTALSEENLLYLVHKSKDNNISHDLSFFANNITTIKQINIGEFLLARYHNDFMSKNSDNNQPLSQNGLKIIKGILELDLHSEYGSIFGQNTIKVLSDKLASKSLSLQDNNDILAKLNQIICDKTYSEGIRTNAIYCFVNDDTPTLPENVINELLSTLSDDNANIQIRQNARVSLIYQISKNDQYSAKIIDIITDQQSSAITRELAVGILLNTNKTALSEEHFLHLVHKAKNNNISHNLTVTQNNITTIKQVNIGEFLLEHFHKDFIVKNGNQNQPLSQNGLKIIKGILELNLYSEYGSIIGQNTIKVLVDKLSNKSLSLQNNNDIFTKLNQIICDRTYSEGIRTNAIYYFVNDDTPTLSQNVINELLLTLSDDNANIQIRKNAIIAFTRQIQYITISEEHIDILLRTSYNSELSIHTTNCILIFLEKADKNSLNIAKKILTHSAKLLLQDELSESSCQNIVNVLDKTSKFLIGNANIGCDSQILVDIVRAIDQKHINDKHQELLSKIILDNISVSNSMYIESNFVKALINIANIGSSTIYKNIHGTLELLLNHEQNRTIHFSDAEINVLCETLDNHAQGGKENAFYILGYRASYNDIRDEQIQKVMNVLDSSNITPGLVFALNKIMSLKQATKQTTILTHEQSIKVATFLAQQSTSVVACADALSCFLKHIELTKHIPINIDPSLYVLLLKHQSQEIHKLVSKMCFYYLRSPYKLHKDTLEAMSRYNDDDENIVDTLNIVSLASSYQALGDVSINLCKHVLIYNVNADLRKLSYDILKLQNNITSNTEIQRIITIEKIASDMYNLNLLQDTINQLDHIHFNEKLTYNFFEAIDNLLLKSGGINIFADIFPKIISIMPNIAAYQDIPIKLLKNIEKIFISTALVGQDDLFINVADIFNIIIDSDSKLDDCTLDYINNIIQSSDNVAETASLLLRKIVAKTQTLNQNLNDKTLNSLLELLSSTNTILRDNVLHVLPILAFTHKAFIIQNIDVLKNIILAQDLTIDLENNVFKSLSMISDSNEFLALSKSIQYSTKLYAAMLNAKEPTDAELYELVSHTNYIPQITAKHLLVKAQSPQTIINKDFIDNLNDLVLKTTNTTLSDDALIRITYIIDENTNIIDNDITFIESIIQLLHTVVDANRQIIPGVIINKLASILSILTNEKLINTIVKTFEILNEHHAISDDVMHYIQYGFSKDQSLLNTIHAIHQKIVLNFSTSDNDIQLLEQGLLSQNEQTIKEAVKSILLILRNGSNNIDNKIIKLVSDNIPDAEIYNIFNGLYLNLNNFKSTNNIPYLTARFEQFFLKNIHDITILNNLHNAQFLGFLPGDVIIQELMSNISQNQELIKTKLSILINQFSKNLYDYRNNDAFLNKIITIITNHLSHYANATSILNKIVTNIKNIDTLNLINIFLNVDLDGLDIDHISSESFTEFAYELLYHKIKHQLSFDKIFDNFDRYIKQQIAYNANEKNEIALRLIDLAANDNFTKTMLNAYFYILADMPQLWQTLIIVASKASVSEEESKSLYLSLESSWFEKIVFSNFKEIKLTTQDCNRIIKDLKLTLSIEGISELCSNLCSDTTSVQLLDLVNFCTKHKICDDDILNIVNNTQKTVNKFYAADIKLHITHAYIDKSIALQLHGIKHHILKPLYDLTKIEWPLSSINKLIDSIQSKHTDLQKKEFLKIVNNIVGYKLVPDDVLEILKNESVDTARKKVHKLGQEKNFSSNILNKDLDTLLQEIYGKNQSNIMIKNLIDNDILRKEINIINQFYLGEIDISIPCENGGFICHWSEKQISEWAAKAILKEDLDPLEIIAVMQRANILDSKNMPRQSQILTLLIMLHNGEDKGMLAQVNTGEGKSTIVAMLATLKAIQGNTVDIITSSSVLAQRDAKEKEDFYAMFNLTVGDNGDPDNKERYDKNIIYGNVSNFQFDYLRDGHLASGVKHNRKCECVIVDEVDSMLIDSGTSSARLNGNSLGMDTINQIFYLIYNQLEKIESHFYTRNGKLFWIACQFAEVNGDLRVADAGNVDDNIIEIHNKIAFIRERLQDYMHDIYNAEGQQSCILIPNHLKQFVQDSMDKWINSAIVAMYSIAENIHYNIRDHKIVIVDHANTGVFMYGQQWSDGLHQFIQIKHGLRVSVESLVTTFISNVDYFKKYGSKIYGLTGTLGDHNNQQLLEHIYDINLSFIPTYKPKQFLEFPAILSTSIIEWLNNIIENTITEINNGRAVLIICNTINNVSKVCNALRANNNINYNNVSTYYESSASEQALFEQRIGVGKIIVATNLAGRGTDLKLTNDVEQNGGLHICLTFLPTNQRVEDQGFGRTSRQGNSGTAIMIINEASTMSELSYRNVPESGDIDFITELRDSIAKNNILESELKSLNLIQLKDVFFAKYSQLYKEYNQTIENLGSTEWKMHLPIILSKQNGSKYYYTHEQYKEYLVKQSNLLEFENIWGRWLRNAGLDDFKDKNDGDSIDLYYNTSQYDLDCTPVQNGVDSFYHALLCQIKIHDAKVLRSNIDGIKKVIFAHLLDNNGLYHDIFSDNFYNAYCDSSIWSDNTLIIAAARALGVNIIVLKHDNTHVAFKTNHNNKTLYLGYEPFEGYYSLLKKTNTANSEHKNIDHVLKQYSDDTAIYNNNILNIDDREDIKTFVQKMNKSASQLYHQKFLEKKLYAEQSFDNFLESATQILISHSLVKNIFNKTLLANSMLLADKSYSDSLYNDAMQLDDVYSFIAEYNLAALKVEKADIGHAKALLLSAEQKAKERLIPLYQSMQVILHYEQNKDTNSLLNKQIDNKIAILNTQLNKIAQAIGVIESVENNNNHNKQKYKVILKDKISIKNALGGDDDNDPEIQDFSNIGLKEFFTLDAEAIIEKKSFFTTLCVGLVGVLQMVVGVATVCIPGGQAFGASLILEGVKDIYASISSLIKGEAINIRDYLAGKVLDYALAAITMGWENLKSGVAAARDGISKMATTVRDSVITSLGGTVVKESATTMITDASFAMAKSVVSETVIKFGAHKALGYALNSIGDDIIDSYEADIESKVLSKINTLVSNDLLDRIIKKIALLDIIGSRNNYINDIFTLGSNLLRSETSAIFAASQAIIHTVLDKYNTALETVLTVAEKAAAVNKILSITDSFCDKFINNVGNIWKNMPEDKQILNEYLTTHIAFPDKISSSQCDTIYNILQKNNYFSIDRLNELMTIHFGIDARFNTVICNYITLRHNAYYGNISDDMSHNIKHQLSSMITSNIIATVKGELSHPLANTAAGMIVSKVYDDIKKADAEARKLAKANNIKSYIAANFGDDIEDVYYDSDEDSYNSDYESDIEEMKETDKKVNTAKVKQNLKTITKKQIKSSIQESIDSSDRDTTQYSPEEMLLAIKLLETAKTMNLDPVSLKDEKTTERVAEVAQIDESIKYYKDLSKTGNAFEKKYALNVVEQLETSRNDVLVGRASFSERFTNAKEYAKSATLVGSSAQYVGTAIVAAENWIGETASLLAPEIKSKSLAAINTGMELAVENAVYYAKQLFGDDAVNNTLKKIGDGVAYVTKDMTEEQLKVVEYLGVSVGGKVVSKAYQGVKVHHMSHKVFNSITDPVMKEQINIRYIKDLLTFHPQEFTNGIAVIETAMYNGQKITDLSSKIQKDFGALIKTTKDGTINGIEHMQNHHIMHKATNEFKDAFQKAGWSLDDPINRIMLPDGFSKDVFQFSKEEWRSLHLGKHNPRSKEDMLKALSAIKFEDQQQWRTAVTKILLDERQKLMDGTRVLNQAKTNMEKTGYK